MSCTDVTVELAALPPGRTSATPQERDTTVIDIEIERLATPLGDHQALLERMSTLWSEVVGTPSRSALATLWAVLLIVVLATWLSQPERKVETATGPAHVSCGLDVYLYGYPDHSVASTCRAAEALRFGFFIPALLGVIIGLIAMSTIVARRGAPLRGRERRLFGWVTGARREALAMAIGMVALVGGLFSLRPVPASWVSSGVLVTAHCGADTYFGGYPVQGVDAVCSRAFATQGHILEVCAVLVLLGAVVAIRLAYSSTVNRRRLIRVASAVALAFVAAVALRPVSVVETSLDQPGASAAGPATISCAVDVWLVGYPQPHIQHICRSVLATRAPVGLATGGASVGLVVWGLLSLPGQPKKRASPRIHDRTPASNLKKQTL
jgi:hypothetical protein